MGNTLITYRDWVSKAGTPNISLDLNFGTEIIDLDHVKNPSLKKITRIQPVLPTNTHIASISLSHSNTNRENGYDGKLGFSVGLIGLLNHNLIVDKLIRYKIIIKQFDGSNIVVDAGFFDQSSINYFNPQYQTKNTFFILPQKYENVEKVYFQIIDTGSIIDIGRLWIGDYMETGVDAGWSQGLSSTSGRIESIGGSATLTNKPRFNEGSMEFTLIPEERAYGGLNTFEDLAMTVAKDRDLIIVRDRDRLQSSSKYGTVTNDIVITHQTGPYYQTKIDIKELI